MSVETQICPSCKQLTIVPFVEGESADCSVCQNSECRVAIDRDGKIVGRWDVGYKKFARAQG